jgi:hypothetical protein
MTAAQRARLFRLVDGYTRSQHGWFVAEMDLNGDETEWTICFRPVSSRRNSPDRYACRYMQIEARQALRGVRQKALTVTLAEQLDRELKSLAS